MGLLDRLESGTERVFTAPFARLFRREELQPVEIGAAIRKAMDSRAAVVNRHRTIVPNVFTIELSDDDFDRLISYDEAITDELIADAQEYVTQQRYTPGGPLQVELVADPDLQPGVYRLHHATVRNPATLDERGDIDTWGADHERFDDVIDRHTQGQRIPADARYLGEVDEEAIAEAQGHSTGQPLEAQDGPSAREQRRLEKERARAEREEAKEQARRQKEEAKEAERQAEADRAERERAEADRAERERVEAERLDRQRAEQERAEADRRERELEAQRAEIRRAQEAQRTQAAAAAAEETRRSTRAVERPWVEVDGTRHPLGGTTVLGRDTSCDVTVNDPGVSRRHAELLLEEAGGRPQLTVKDLGSTNGTFVGGERVQHARLGQDDSFVVGRTTVRVHLGHAR